MKHIVLTVLVCLDVGAFAALYLRATEIVTHAIAERLSEISVVSDRSVPHNLTRGFVDTGVHKFTLR